MTHELAQKLKDAGFPQPTINVGTWFFDELGHVNIYLGGEQIIKDAKKCAVIPTLSELIDACGKGFMGLHKNHAGTFLAYSAWDYENPSEEEEDPHAIANSPEIAVANLWLALNAKT